MKKLTNFKRIDIRHFRWLLIFAVFIGISFSELTAQVTITTTFTNNNGFSLVTFNFQNTNASDVIITEIGSVTSNSGLTTADVYYNTTAINGAPGAISSANGWNSFGTGTYTAVSNTTTSTAQTMLSGLSLLVPAGATYGIAFSTTNLRYSTLAAGSYSIPGGGCNILTGTNIGYGGDFAPNAPPNTPRGFIGFVTFISATPCSGIPVAGTSVSSTDTVMAGQTFSLSNTGGTSATGLTYQWQSSPDNSIWTNIPGATSGTYSTTETASTYFQCIVTCTSSGQSDTSTSVLIVLDPSVIMTNGTATVCSTNFYDSGGPTGTYQNNENYTLTLFPATPGAALQVVFNSFDLETCCDDLTIYDGNSTAAPLIGTFTVSPGTIQSTASDGSLTFVFSTDGSVTYAGWSAVINCLSPCSGTPVAGTVTAPASVCAGNNINLTLTGYTISSGITLQWQSSPDNITFSDIAGATSASYTTTQTVTTYYQCIVTCTASGLSDTSASVQVLMELPSNCYCASNATTTADEEIFNVTAGTLNNTSDCSTVAGPGSLLNEYSNFTGLTPPDFQQSVSVPFSVEVNTCGTSNYNSGLAIFIDFNQNGLFSDAGEKVYSNGPLANITCVPSTIVSGTFNVPLSATLGNTRMRIIDAEGNAGDVITPCLTYGYGETEDYTVNIVAAPTCIQPDSLTATNITDISADLGWVTNNGETAWDIEYGISGFVPGTGTVINDISTNPYTLTGLTSSTNYQYYVLAQCSPTDSSYWSGPFSFTTLISACTGTPVAGTVISTNDTVFTAQLFTLSLTGGTIASGFTYQWQSSPDNISWTNIPGATADTLTTSLTADTYYQCIVTCTSSGLSDTSTYILIILDPSVIMTNGSATVCSGNFYDSGGPAGQYLNNEIYTLTLYPSTPGAALQVVFNSFTVETCCDDLTIYDGNSTAAPLIGTFTSSPGTIQSTAADGSLTFVFSSDGSVVYDGWNATIACLSPCSGTPSAGVIAAPAGVCPGDNFVLTLTGNTVAAGITYQWQSSPDNITFSDIAGATSASYTGTQTLSTYYQCIVTCTASGLSDTTASVQVLINPPSNCYCASNATNTADEEIFNVTVGSLNNTSDCSTVAGPGSILNEYSNFTAIAPPALLQTLSTSLSVEVNTCGSTNYNSGLAIFIDYNQNGLFTDPGERVFSNGALADITCVPLTVVTGSFIVPLSAIPGNTRMRVIDTEGNAGDNIDPCATYGYGETEDYTVTIVSVTCPPPSGLTASGITQTSAQLSWTNGGTETAWDIQYGFTGFVLGTGTIVNNVSTNPYTLNGLTASSSYQYYVSAQCSPTDSSYWAGPFSFSTQCGPTTAVYVQNFDGVTAPAIPNCWNTVVLGSSGSPFVQTSTISPNSVPNCAQLFNSTSSGVTTHILLVSPQFSDLPSQTTQITFWARYEGTGPAVLNLGTMSNPANPATFSLFQSITTLTNTWQEFIIPFSTYVGTNQYIAFKHGLGGTNLDLFIDDVVYDFITSANQQELAGNISVYPNPTDGKFVIELNASNNSDYLIELYSIDGRKVFTREYKNVKEINDFIDGTKLAEGIYNLKVSGNGKQEIIKLVIF